MSEATQPLRKDPIYERWRWQVFAITWLAYAGFNLTRASFPVAKIGLGEGTAAGFSDAQMAWIDGAYLTAYALGQFLSGVAGDRFGIRKVVLTGMFCSVLASVAMGASSLAASFGIIFFFQGLCQSTGWSPLVKNVGNFFSRRERGFVLGLWCTNYSVGGLAAAIYAGYLGQRFGWRYAFFIPAATLLVIWILFLFFQRNRPEDVGLPPVDVYHQEPVAVIKPGDLPGDEPEGSWKVILQVIRNPVVLLLALVYFCLKPVRYALLFWGPKYVHERLGAGMAESGLLSGMFEFAGPFSIVAAGLVSDRLFGTRRMPVSIICMLLLGVMLLFLDDLPRSRWILAGSLFLLGLLTYAPDALISAVAPVDFGTQKGASTASGFINGAGSLGAIIGGTVPGFFADQWGWQGVFTLLAGAVFMAALLLLPKWNALPPTVNERRSPQPGR